MSQIKVLVYPRDKNPYQEMLYSAFPENAEVRYIENPTKSHITGLILLPAQLFSMRLLGFRIFHLHWLYPFRVIHIDDFLLLPTSKIISYIYIRFILFFLKIIGMKLVWTMHNEMPHESITIDDKDIMNRVLRSASIIVLLTKESVEKYERVAELKDKLLFLPMGHFIGRYPTASFKLKREKGSVNFLFFGMIREYKGVVRLVEEFRSLKYPHVRLRVVGKTFDKNLDQAIRRAIGDDKRIIYQNEGVRDQDVRAYFDWADAVVLPYFTVTNSSTAILSLSFKKPIIAPRIGSLRDLPEESGFYYEYSQSDGLKASLEKAIAKNDILTQMGERGYNYVCREHSWDKIVEMTYDIYKTTLK